MNQNKKPLPNKKQRHEIYKAVLKAFNDTQSLYMAICKTTSDEALKLGFDLYKVHELEHAFKELKKYNPLPGTGFSNYFFPFTKEGKHKRIEILNQLIKETE